MTRNASFDYARLLAVFGIVLFHSGAPGAAWGYAGLPFFLLLLGVFAAPAAARLSTAAYARTRARRLLTPWLIWSAIYAALLAVQAARNGRPVLADFDASMLLTGPALHLWFLPFAFVAGCALHALARAVGVRPVLGWIGASTAFVALGVSEAGPWPVPLAQWIFAIPSLGLGLLLSTEPRRWQLLGLALVLGGAAALGWTQDILPLALALVGFALCWVVRLPETAQTRGLTDVALVVYLAHPLVQTVLVWGTGMATDSLASVALVIVISVGMALIGSRMAALLRTFRPIRTVQH